METTPQITLRTPAEIAADAQALFDAASKAFVPPNIVRAAELNVEFMHAIVAHLDACEELVTSLLGDDAVGEPDDGEPKTTAFAPEA